MIRKLIGLFQLWRTFWTRRCGRTRWVLSLLFYKTGRRRFLVTHPVDYPGMTLDEAMAKKFFRITPTSVFEAIAPIILLTIIALT